jgi:hypothetical protein
MDTAPGTQLSQKGDRGPMSRLVIFKAPYEELRKADISPTFQVAVAQTFSASIWTTPTVLPPKWAIAPRNLEAMAISKPHPLAGAPGK